MKEESDEESLLSDSLSEEEADVDEVPEEDGEQVDPVVEKKSAPLFNATKDRQRQTAAEKAEKKRNAFAAQRDVNFDILIKTAYTRPGDAVCCHCPATHNLVRCQQCAGPQHHGSPHRYFCTSCFVNYHKFANEWHAAEVWRDGAWWYLGGGKLSPDPPSPNFERELPDPICPLGKDCKNSAEKHPHSVLVYGIEGPPFHLHYKSCSCHVMGTLIALGVFPLTPQHPTTAFTLALMELYHKVSFVFWFISHSFCFVVFSYHSCDLDPLLCRRMRS